MVLIQDHPFLMRFFEFLFDRFVSRLARQVIQLVGILLKIVQIKHRSLW